ncbi:hypothetical protein H257_12456 [Aphanomyces astaci]|uniref:Uncharacterized protein n=1 Tax=Aphanomyces astaci TaxID=112090 RepID=W4G0C8_APHAT|nr:hypothetical protein H257_12456 [Aphanomyces astaci]ETV72741.1 hypothetical protein H257_12456 [Aphanomyces astaci]|eukprot:XP_009837969.1 hypothetical protein H257_12456 [Aphanomyces astaci]
MLLNHGVYLLGGGGYTEDGAGGAGQQRVPRGLPPPPPEGVGGVVTCRLVWGHGRNSSIGPVKVLGHFTLDAIGDGHAVVGLATTCIIITHNNNLLFVVRVAAIHGQNGRRHHGGLLRLIRYITGFELDQWCQLDQLQPQRILCQSDLVHRHTKLDHPFSLSWVE